MVSVNFPFPENSLYLTPSISLCYFTLILFDSVYNQQGGHIRKTDTNTQAAVLVPKVSILDRGDLDFRSSGITSCWSCWLSFSIRHNDAY